MNTMKKSRFETVKDRNKVQISYYLEEKTSRLLRKLTDKEHEPKNLTSKSCLMLNIQVVTSEDNALDYLLKMRKAFIIFHSIINKWKQNFLCDRFFYLLFTHLVENGGRGVEVRHDL